MLKNLKKKFKSKKAFTLIELIIVIAIIGVLIAILVPTMTGFVTQAREATAKANARTIYSIAQAEATFAATEGTVVAEGTQTYIDGTTSVTEGTYLYRVVQQVGDLANGAAFAIVVNADGDVDAVTYRGADTQTGVYPSDATAYTFPAAGGGEEGGE